MALNKILFVTSEVHPLIKTGGLADVSYSLPVALKALRREVRIILPAYRTALKNIGASEEIAVLSIDKIDAPVRILEGRLPGSSVKVWLVDSPAYFDRDGGPYQTPDGEDWPDNAQRFTLFSRVIELIALGKAGLSWQPDLVHCNDWQSGLVPALLARVSPRPATVFTIHNLSYQGLFSQDTFWQLGLPQDLWSMHSMEYFGRFSFIKGGIVYADMLSTVSAQYAREIRTPAFGCGLEDLLHQRGDRLVGILNGVDYSQWSPAKDPYIARQYNAYSLPLKAVNKTALQTYFGLPADKEIPLLGMIGRLVEQKGFDLMLAALPWLMEKGVQLVILGSGEKALEQELREATLRYPSQLATHLGYHEELAHQIEAGADIFVMPSRFEPCGLNQMYSLRYGAVPVVRRTGGLADTVVDATPEALQGGVATGFLFDEAAPQPLLEAVDRALWCYRQPKLWKRLIFQGMQQDFSWRKSAQRYLALYRQTGERGAGEMPPIGYNAPT